MKNSTQALVIRETSSGKNPDIAETIEKLGHLGIDTVEVLIGEGDNLLNQDRLPDIIVLALESIDALEIMNQLSSRLKSGSLTNGLPTLALGDRINVGALSADSHADFALAPHVLAAKMKRLIRLSSMQIEYTARAQSALTFGIEAADTEAIAAPIPTPRVLVAGKGERYFAITRLFNGGATLTCSRSMQEAEEQLNINPYDVLLVDPTSLDYFDVDDLIYMKRNPDYQALPIIVLSEGLRTDDEKILQGAGISDIYPLEDAGEDVASCAFALVREQVYSKRLKEAFRSSEFQAISDDLTGVFNADFFKKHLARLLAQAKIQHSTVAVGTLHITIESVDAEDSASRVRSLYFLKQIASTIERLVRVDDVLAHLGDGTFAIAVTRENETGMEALLRRIRAIIRHTNYQVGQHTASLNVSVNHCVSTPDISVKTLLKHLKETSD